jgi:hypothetical protein
MKHGHGKAIYAGVQGKGNEEYEGDWVDDKMHGYGRYQFTSGGVYTGQWHEGSMHGQGKIVNADGTSYSGEWNQNRMHGEGTYIDIDGVKWDGIFINGSYESKIQKKLRAEKEVADKVKKFENQAKEFLHSASSHCQDRQEITKLLASPDTCIDYVAEPYPRFSDFDQETWQNIFGSIFQGDAC